MQHVAKTQQMIESIDEMTYPLNGPLEHIAAGRVPDVARAAVGGLVHREHRPCTHIEERE